MGTVADDDDVASLVELAKDDWTDMGALSAAVAHRVGPESSVELQAAALGELVCVLIDHDVVPGDLGSDPDFLPWPGTKEDRVARVIRETLDLGELPRPTQIAWFHHEPAASPNCWNPSSTSHRWE